MEKEAIKLTESILKSLNKIDSPLKPIIEAVIEKELRKANFKGYEEATLEHLEIIKNIL